MDPTYWRELVAPVVAGRKLILTGSPVAGQTAQVNQLRALGAADVFVLGEGMGTGPEPDCGWFALDVHGNTTMEAIRAGQSALANLPADARAAVDAFDPGGEALVIGGFLNERTEVAGRRCLMYRKPEWIALEDKTVVDALWDEAGVTRVASRIVRVADLEPQAGVVWAGDARDGFHGGAELTRWIRTETDSADAMALMRQHCDTVRVMPFLEGIPCSIHGFVFPDHVAALRPVEMVTLRRGSEFFYAGAATYWDPRVADREAMRDVAQRVGAVIRRRVGFAGAFTVDGVMTDDGFRPTELNPRQGAGLGLLGRGAPELPFNLLDEALKAGLELDYRPHDFERVVVDIADGARSGGTWRSLEQPLEPRGWKVVWQDDEWVEARAGDPPDGHVVVGPSNLGSFVRLGLDTRRTPTGPPVAPKAAAFYAYLDRELGTEIGPLEAAHDARL